VIAASLGLVHRALKLTITGPSYRMKTFQDGNLAPESDLAGLTELAEPTN